MQCDGSDSFWIVCVSEREPTTVTSHTTVGAKLARLIVQYEQMLIFSQRFIETPTSSGGLADQHQGSPLLFAVCGFEWHSPVV